MGDKHTYKQQQQQQTSNGRVLKVNQQFNKKNTTVRNVIFCLIVFSAMTMIALPIGQSFAQQVPVEELPLKKTCIESASNPSKENAKPQGNKFVKYGNSSVGFEIEYPSDWSRSEMHCLLEHQNQAYSSSIVNFNSTLQSRDQGLLGVAVSDFILRTSIESFAKVYESDFNNYVKSTEITNLSGKPAVRFSMDLGNNIPYIMITTFANDKKYDITYFDANWISGSTIQHMISSFKVSNVSETTTMDKGQTEFDEFG